MALTLGLWRVKFANSCAELAPQAEQIHQLKKPEKVHTQEKAIIYLNLHSQPIENTKFQKG